MSWRTVVVSRRSKLDLKMGYLVIRGDETKRVFLDEISVLIIENPAVSLTGNLLEALSQRKVAIVFCDKERNPYAELVSLYGAHDTSKKIDSQINWSNETKAIVWKNIVHAKIRNQIYLLEAEDYDESADKLKSYLNQIEPNDATNREGHAAKVYFNSLFGMEFTRDDESPVNAALNYGYTILLSAFNREIVSNGYLTQIGVHHINQFNWFNLSSDLMEPYRILVDRAVVAMKPDSFGSEEKYDLIDVLNKIVDIEYSEQTVLNSITIYCKSVFNALNNNDVSLIHHFEL